MVKSDDRESRKLSPVVVAAELRAVHAGVGLGCWSAGFGVISPCLAREAIPQLAGLTELVLGDQGMSSVARVRRARLPEGSDRRSAAVW